MKMSPKEVELTLRAIVAGLLRSYTTRCLPVLLQLEPKAEMAGVGENVMMPVEDLIRIMEEGYSRGTIPAPAAANKKVKSTLARITAELEQLTVEVFLSERDESTPEQFTTGDAPLCRGCCATTMVLLGGVYRCPKCDTTEEVPPPARQEVRQGPVNDAPPCHECGSLMVRNGSTWRCKNCGATSGAVINAS